MCFFHRHHAGFKKDGSENLLSKVHVTKDISTFDRSEIEELIGEQEIDVLIGGPRHAKDLRIWEINSEMTPETTLSMHIFDLFGGPHQK